MASEPRRPPTRTGSGSRPPTSRFQEGSMNDRASAAPPVQFLGPEQLKEYENQFYTEPPAPREARRQRPLSATGKLQASTIYQHVGGEELQRRTVRHKKSASFFSRIRNTLFHRGGGQHGDTPKDQDVRRKHTSLQEPLHHPLPPPPPRPDYMQYVGRTQSEVNVAQLFPNPRGAADRPSREDVMASYNQLVASGFFQSHAIQSTRHAAPKAAPAAAGGQQTPASPVIHQTVPCPPVRISSIHANNRSSSASPMPIARSSPNPQARHNRDCAGAAMAPPAAPRSSLSSLFRPSIPDLHTKDSWLTLRGRKRARGDGDETPTAGTPEPQSVSTGSGGYFAQPLKKVAKKLRQMPSSSSQLNGKNIKNTVPMPQQPTHKTAADEIVRLVPSVSIDGSVYPSERPVRLRSPSPAMPEVTSLGDNERRSIERPLFHERAGPAAGMRRPRKTFSYTLTESSRGRGRTIEREREREQSREHDRDAYRVQQRDLSAARPDSRARASRMSQAPPRNPLGQWQGISVEDTIIHRDSVDSTRPGWDWERRDADERTAMSPNAKTRRSAHSPLTAMPDANRGVPSAPKAPERWHGTGKAYHLKDRGSRPELLARRSEGSEKIETRYGKENSNWRSRVDADGDVDVLIYESCRQPREKYYQQEHYQQWRIGNAL
ncbi:hypothetical protein F5X98DRAFT_325751 [Xylaria grammica]|nr:hypothetical protein F5X98DRAFT_325751 [Xylaria grammica]